MITYQQVYVVFYAIMWGAVANAIPRWRAFDTGNWRDKKARRRFWWAILTMNILPLAYFALPLWLLSGESWNKVDRSAWGIAKFLIAALPSLALFGTYRLWLAGVQSQPDMFYPRDLSDEDWNKQFPGLPKEHLAEHQACPNGCFALAYLGVPMVLVIVATLAG